MRERARRAGQMTSGKAAPFLGRNNAASSVAFLTPRETRFWNLGIMRAGHVWVSYGGSGRGGTARGHSNTLSPWEMKDRARQRNRKGLWGTGPLAFPGDTYSEILRGLPWLSSCSEQKDESWGDTSGKRLHPTDTTWDMDIFCDHHGHTQWEQGGASLIPVSGLPLRDRHKIKYRPLEVRGVKLCVISFMVDPSLNGNHF